MYMYLRDWFALVAWLTTPLLYMSRECIPGRKVGGGAIFLSRLQTICPVFQLVVISLLFLDNFILSHAYLLDRQQFQSQKYG